MVAFSRNGLTCGYRSERRKKLPGKSVRGGSRSIRRRRLKPRLLLVETNHDLGLLRHRLKNVILYRAHPDDVAGLADLLVGQHAHAAICARLERARLAMGESSSKGTRLRLVATSLKSVWPFRRMYRLNASARGGDSAIGRDALTGQKYCSPAGSKKGGTAFMGDLLRRDCTEFFCLWQEKLLITFSSCFWFPGSTGRWPVGHGGSA